ncbi:hypothetical protein DICPUDRAFT_155307 [Dictyostelium purpureum]|uniref:Uncharacterized protein n=1 Tax=Dictyostelium purpureum TaxID=5786 RepID=F0ZTM7_DICPU|nr:uncharacterized protein DICPUDRAFT_155307 [Dictyostelium purpureum]EGC32698.1 hypothetical protein DICPUDRAFT_155307 [Dictyostelium purpureum]|eukprot:XP_003290767.1 hypothetical protein DICPUDRAFT_155307 [Dictyostelium purpureum]
MCIVFISFYQNEKHPLIILNNRDEVCERPTIPLSEWVLKKNEIEEFRDNDYISNNSKDYYSKDEDIRIYGGKDKIGGGTWLGVNNRGKFCIILNLYNKNFHDSSSGSGKLSRGKIVHNYLSSKISPFDYISLMEKNRHQYHPFILIVGDIINSNEKYYCLLSHLLPPKELYNKELNVKTYPSYLKAIERDTVFGISNYPLEWNTPKVTKGKQRLSDTLKEIFEKKAHSLQEHSDPHSCQFEEEGSLNQLFTSDEESKILDILYIDKKEDELPSPTEHINTSAIFVNPYHSIYSKKIHSTVSSSLITFDRLPHSSEIIMSFLQVDNINKKTFKIRQTLK